MNNTNDLIRRGDTIDAVYERIKQIGFENNANVLSIRQTVREVPSAQSELKWIPCSERLPHGSCSDLVNVSIHDDSGDTPFDYTSCGWVTVDGEYWIVDNEINNHVIAWMPLPEPYKEPI